MAVSSLFFQTAELALRGRLKKFFGSPNGAVWRPFEMGLVFQTALL
ncbi:MULTISPECIES: hypothetical protein [unclassified Neisseria]|nr:MULTISPECIES: hypothetical protein [unclassified Neisseria]MBF0802799.1 hypothetical protein [Neisseria sp. 19428wB4_WF04]